MFVWAGQRIAAIREQALARMGAGVMIAGPDLVILEANPAMVALLRPCEAAIRAAAPQISLDALPGADAGALCSALRDPAQPGREVQVALGDRTFSVRATPLARKGVQDGFVLEWSDVTAALRDREQLGLVTAINRCQAVIEFTPDGTILRANPLFLRLTGYTLDQIEGRHHEMFVPAEHRNQMEYRRFWEALRRGEGQSGRFRRVGRDGADIWIEGSYTPILDEAGSVTRVVKFADDVTDRVTMMGDLDRLIGQNLAQIDAVIARSADEGDLATQSARSTSGGMQAVAASSAELAASIGEIAGSMARSRSATENAFEQTVSVGRSTETLSTAAQAMGGIVGLIRNVAGQINLLALNATIEAARAGDAGKGFAVVASEVKNLAIQASGATDQISSEIDGIQTIAAEVAAALAAIRESVTVVRESVLLTASAVEEQSAVTRTMSDTMQQTVGAADSLAGNVVAISAGVREAAELLTTTREAAASLVH